MKLRKCSECGLEKSLLEFRQRKYKSGKLYHLKQCRSCENEKQRLYSRKKHGYNPKGTPKQSYKEIAGEVHTKCSICGEYKPLEKYTVDSRNKSFGRTNICKVCRKDLRREKYENIIDENAIINKIFLNSKHRATLGNIKFTITREDITFTEKCPYLNIKMEYKGDRSTSPSLDRINNTKGYIPDNVKVISTLANMVKRTLSIEDLLIFSKNVIQIHDK